MEIEIVRRDRWFAWRFVGGTCLELAGYSAARAVRTAATQRATELGRALLYRDAVAAKAAVAELVSLADLAGETAVLPEVMQ